MSLVVDVLVVPDCPRIDDLVQRVREIAARLAPGTAVRVIEVRDAKQVDENEFPGSPTVRVDGQDLEGRSAGPPALACRLYDDGTGLPPVRLIEAGFLRALRPQHLLFLCVANSARSQLAEGIARGLAPGGVRISSAGSEPSSVRPQAIRALAEIGIDATGHRSKSVEEFMAGDVDCVVTLCAEENCPVWLSDATRVHWPLPDPAAIAGSDAQVMDSFRQVRDELRRRLALLFR